MCLFVVFAATLCLNGNIRQKSSTPLQMVLVFLELPIYLPHPG